MGDTGAREVVQCGEWKMCTCAVGSLFHILASVDPLKPPHHVGLNRHRVWPPGLLMWAACSLFFQVDHNSGQVWLFGKRKGSPAFYEKGPLWVSVPA